MSPDPISLAISSLSLAVSATTAWFTLLRAGTVRMTRPTTIFFGPDGKDGSSSPKVYLRTLLFATSKRGRILESMHISLSRNETKQTFNVWIYGDERLVRGSGLFVGESGVAANHHFLLPRDESHFKFTEGTYELEVFVKLLGSYRKTRLFRETLHVSQENARKLADSDAGLFFDWGPDSSRYLAHIDSKGDKRDRSRTVDAFELLMNLAKSNEVIPETTTVP